MSNSFEQNINSLKSVLKSRGWSYSKEDKLFEFYKNVLGAEFKLPKIKTDKEYPKLFEISLKKIKEINPEIATLPLFSIIISQCKNMRQKYSKNKKSWILSEPNSKYIQSEIPEIYIPKNYIFDKKE